MFDYVNHDPQIGLPHTNECMGIIKNIQTDDV